MFKLIPIALGGLLALSAQPAFACSDPGPIGHAISADVIVVGHERYVAASGRHEVVTARTLKGPGGISYAISWPPVDQNDECAFLGPATRDRGVYFLRRGAEGTYVVIWTERRWENRWTKYLANRGAPK